MTEPVLVEVRTIESAQFYLILPDLRYLRIKTPVHGLVNYPIRQSSNMVYLLLSRPLARGGEASITSHVGTRVISKPKSVVSL
jgi:hypothetical protein